MERTVRVLHEDYGFSKERSREAVNAIPNKGDVQMAYNWLFDHGMCVEVLWAYFLMFPKGEEDKGGAVDFIICDHLTAPMEKRLIPLSQLQYGKPCQECAYVHLFFLLSFFNLTQR